MKAHAVHKWPIKDPFSSQILLLGCEVIYEGNLELMETFSSTNDVSKPYIGSKLQCNGTKRGSQSQVKGSPIHVSRNAFFISFEV